MMKKAMQKIKLTAWGCIMALTLVLLLLILHFASGTPVFAPSAYNSYTLQALAWRRGLPYLQQDVPHLELAIKDGLYFVSFPPVPSIPLYLLSFILGDHTPDGLLVKLYALIAYLAMYRALRHQGRQDMYAALSSFLLCAASSMLPLLLSGAVWYQAQVMAFMFTALAVSGMLAKHYTSALLCYSLSVGCRPFNVIYGFLLLYIFLINMRSSGKPSLKPAMKLILPGLILGLCVAGGYAWYNSIRFGSPFEFGHSYLPEFSFQGGQQFSLAHIQKNAATFILGLPFVEGKDGLALRSFGFSLFIANPALLLMMVLFCADVLKRRAGAYQTLIILLFALHLLLLLSHRTFGGFQFGARYAVDLIPYTFAYLAGRELPWGWKKPCLLVMLAGLAFSIFGSLMIRLPG